MLARCASESPGAVLVTGEAVVGKTRLLDELAGRLRSGGALVLRGNAVHGGGPFRPLARALVRVSPPELAEAPELRPYAAVLARLLPGWPLRPLEAGHLVDPVVVLGEAVRALLHVLGDGRRSALLLDDLHWADRDTLDLLEYLSADPPMPRSTASKPSFTTWKASRTRTRVSGWLALINMGALLVVGPRAHHDRHGDRRADRRRGAPAWRGL
jgi:hypothetical protein